MSVYLLLDTLIVSIGNGIHSKAGYIYFQLIFLGISKVFLPLIKNLINGELLEVLKQIIIETTLKLTIGLESVFILACEYFKFFLIWFLSCALHQVVPPRTVTKIVKIVHVN